MRKTYIIIAVILLSILLTGCSPIAETAELENNVPALEPEISEIRSICNLATLECYYHNVAISQKSAGGSLENIFEVDRTFWIEYSGIVKIGIDASAIEMAVDNTVITVTLPSAKIISIKVDESSIDRDSIIVSDDGWLNKNPIYPEEQTEAIRQAQDNMLLSAEENTALLMTAQERAKELIEVYITQISEFSGIQYEIVWMLK